MDVDEAAAWIEYDRAVFERYLRSAQRLGWAEATRDRGTGHGSIKDTLVHILNVHEAWLVAVARGRWTIFDDPGRRPADVRSWRQLRTYRDRVWNGTESLLHGLTARRLRQKVRAPWMPGEYTLADAFRQVSVEQAHHLGEIIGVYWQLDRAPPVMTWIENRPRRRRGTRRAVHR